MRSVYAVCGFGVGSLLTAVVLVLRSSPIATVLALGAAVSTPAPPPATVAPAPPGPPCIHEVCADRPAGLTCTWWRDGAHEVACGRFKLEYERHCECDTWGSLPVREK